MQARPWRHKITTATMEWQLKTSGIVSVRVEHTRSFEGASASFSYATGFLVDERGIVLTNRHVATTGPCTYDLSWANGEVTPATCIYRDPVHGACAQATYERRMPLHVVAPRGLTCFRPPPAPRSFSAQTSPSSSTRHPACGSCSPAPLSCARG